MRRMTEEMIRFLIVAFITVYCTMSLVSLYIYQRQFTVNY